MFVCFSVFLCMYSNRRQFENTHLLSNRKCICHRQWPCESMQCHTSVAIRNVCNCRGCNLDYWINDNAVSNSKENSIGGGNPESYILDIVAFSYPSCMQHWANVVHIACACETIKLILSFNLSVCCLVKHNLTQWTVSYCIVAKQQNNQSSVQELCPKEVEASSLAVAI